VPLFLHVGDVHIGAERLGGRLPSRDFADAFGEVADAAIADRAAFVLVAGDFFDRPRIEPNHLSEATPALEKLRDAGVPVVAIEGNHDVVSTLDPRPSWLSYLNARGLVRLLRTEFRDGRPAMKEWTERDRSGNWLEIAGARIIGAGWFGASTPRRLELLEPLVERHGFTILLLHAAVDGFHDTFGHVTSAELAPLKGRVDYVAVAHVHRRYVIDGWIHNPGALENWRLDEEAFGDEKGYFRVTYGGATAVEHRPVRRRPVRLASIDVAGLASVAAVEPRVRDEASRWAREPRAAVHVSLVGRPAFDPSQIDAPALARAVEEACPCAAAEVVVRPGAGAPAMAESAVATPRDVIEREELERMIAATGRYAGREKEMLAFVREALELGLRGAPEEEFVHALRKRGESVLGEDPAHPPVEREVVRGR